MRIYFLIILSITLFCSEEINGQAVKSQKIPDPYQYSLGIRGGVPTIGLSFQFFENDELGFLIIGGYKDALFTKTYSLNTNVQYYPDRNNYGFQYFVGGGASWHYEEFKTWFWTSNDNYFGLNTMVGAEYKIKDFPLVFGLDWSPTLYLLNSNNKGTFKSGGISIKFTI